LNQSKKEEEQTVEEEIAASYEKLEEDISTYLPGIVCWGDSLTAGAGGNGTTYPNVLESLIKEQFVDRFDAEQIAETLGQNNITGLQRAIINHQEMSEVNQGKFIIVGLHTGTAAGRSGLEKAMQAEYGDQYINLREYMSTSGLQDAGIEANDEDKEMMAEGMTPSSLFHW
jgi:hypothetical protein